MLDKTLFEKALRWFQPEFRAKMLAPIESQFPGFRLPPDIQEVVRNTESLLEEVGAWPGSPLTAEVVDELLVRGNQTRMAHFKQIMLRYRRYRAADTEIKREKTFNLGLINALEEEIKALDTLVGTEWFERIEPRRLPRLKDFLPLQLIESEALQQAPFLSRQFDQKFPILQAQNLFLPDLAYFRGKCEDRESLLAVAFLDIDNLKQFNTKHTEPKVDRNLFPLFLQTVEAHVYHHGYAYQEGGDEVMILVPSLSRKLSVVFFDELRVKLANLEYPDIAERTTVSIGLCIVEPDCPLTDRELRDRASLAKRFAKNHGRNCIATFRGPRLREQELEVVRPGQPDPQ